MKSRKVFEGKYRIIKVLGQGGMGKVYLAENIRLGTLWAIKEIPKKPGGEANLPVEPDILRKLSHPALPRVFDVLEDADSVYIIFDYIEGTGLDKKLAEAGRFPEEIVLDWASQLCDVLSYLHSFKPNPIIYRDMKPSNIILTPDGRIKLIDFGIAREYKEGLDSDTTYIGTRGYAAPEQYGCGQTEVASDIYSLGVTLHHLLTGKSPNEPPYEARPVRTLDRSLSAEIENIISRCTRQDPSERYRSAAELKSDVDKLRDSAGRDGEYSIDTANEDSSHGINAKVSNKANKEVSNEAGGKDCRIFKRCEGFRKIILTVWDNAEFGCELAYMAAKLTDLSVVLIDVDLLSPKADMYLKIKKYPSKVFTEGLFNKSSLNIIMNSLEKNMLTSDMFLEASIRRKELKNLFVVTGNYSLDNYEYYSDDSLTRLIEKAYQYFDVVVLLANKSIYDSYTIISLIKSDYNLIPLRANVDNLREFNRYLLFLEEKQQIPLGKYKFIAFEYNRNVNIDSRALKEITGGNYIGSIRYSAKRARYRNLHGTYTGKMEKEVVEDYITILSAFNILPKPGLFGMLKNRKWFPA